MYVQIEDNDVKTMCNMFLRSIGGQVHVQCAEHILPIITSMDRKNGHVSVQIVIESVSSIVMFLYAKDF